VLISIAGNAMLVTGEPEVANQDIKFSWREE